MKRVLIALMIVLMSGFTVQAADDATTAAVTEVLNKLAENYAARNLEATLALFAPDLFVYGTGADEKRSGRAEMHIQMQRDWAQTEAASIAYNWTDVKASGNVAWAASDVTFHITAGEEHMHMPGRITFVLQKYGEKWLIEQMHASFPSAEQAEGKSWPEPEKK